MDFDELMVWLIGIIGAAAIATIGFLIWAAIHTTSGTVVDKFYDDSDLVCSKGCVMSKECWTIVVDKPWYADNRACVDESEYGSISVGDYFTTDK